MMFFSFVFDHISRKFVGIDRNRVPQLLGYFESHIYYLFPPVSRRKGGRGGGMGGGVVWEV